MGGTTQEDQALPFMVKPTNKNGEELSPSTVGGQQEAPGDPSVILGSRAIQELLTVVSFRRIHLDGGIETAGFIPHSSS